ncbi:hypothetical protein GCM10008096_11590 [Zhihengliuella salsuginis]|uniref:ParB/Sulfiredoxin domain-containing protein n=2 Tax=Zhihengliuella salsuginis TaxID=578222 RepID=A0ABQ3GGX9_9MICC|nr:hypothetical protein GCM10008096_11590 [Zhihengliuella salsuginis]
MVTYSPYMVALDEILLDPNNFRFRGPGTAIEVAESRFAEKSVQDAALERIVSDGVTEVKRSIAENGFVPVERIVVRPLKIESSSQTDESGDSATGSSHYVVVEGNRRTAALKLLRKEHASGAALKSSVSDVFDAVPVLLASDASDDDLLAIMGIRHVGGPKEWGGYQSALLVYELMEDSGIDARQVASRLGLTVQEVNRRHRAFSALTQMAKDSEYGELVTPDFYAIFHEVVGQPKLRDWLGWDNSEYELTDSNNREQLYFWLTGDADAPKKITSYGDIRDLKLIIENPDALSAMQDDDQSLADALAIVKSEAKATKWLPNAKAALVSLRDMSLETMENLDDDGVQVLTSLKEKSSAVLRAVNAARSTDEDAVSD